MTKLENRIIEVLNGSGAISVAEMQQKIQLEISGKSLRAVLDEMIEKGLVKNVEVGHSFYYRLA